MNTKHYDDIFEKFTAYHPYLVGDVNDWRPRGDRGIRLYMNNGMEYDFDIVTKGVRKVENYKIEKAADITEDNCRKSISYHLKEMMEMKGYTQQTLSEYTGIGKGSIYNYINGKATPSATALRKIAYALDCSISDLLD